MNAELENISRGALEDARTNGQDYITRTGLAVRAAREAQPDLPASDALALVNLVRRS